MSIFHLSFPKFQKNFDAVELTFSIGNIKSRVPSVGYFVLHCFNYNDVEILVNSKPFYTSKRFFISTTYQEYIKTIELTPEILNQSLYFQIELVLIGITSENPCWFNNVMLETGSVHTEYHKPNESFDESEIHFINNNYVMLYNDSENDLQIIRPLEGTDKITTKKILRSKYTILAPHLANESKYDTPSNLMMEFINQTDQHIQIKK